MWFQKWYSGGRFVKLNHGERLVEILKILPGPLSGAEIGVYAGDTSRMLLEGLNLRRLLMVDRYKSAGSRAVWRRNNQRVDELVRRHQAALKVVGNSVEVAEHVPDRSLDFVFIDADHSYLSVLADIKAWRHKVRSGGIIAGHDYSVRFPGVIRAVDETFPHPWGYYVYGDIWYVQRG